MTLPDRSHVAEVRRRLSAMRRLEQGSGGDDRSEPRLTPIQHEMWLGERLGKAGSAYTTLHAWRLRGALDIDALERSVADVLTRHDAFALRVVSREGHPVPVFGQATTWHGIEAELPQGPDLEAWLRARLSAYARARFALDGGPLVAVHLLLMGPDDAVLVWSMHHLIADDWSYTCIARDLSHYYAGHLGRDVPPLPSIGTGLRGFLSQSPDAGAQQKGHAATGGHIGTDPSWPCTGLECVKPDEPERARTILAAIGHEELEAVRRAARAMGVSSYAVMAALYQVLLARFCDDMVMSVGVSRSLRLSAEDDAKVGMFLDHVDLPGDLRPDQTLADLATHISQVVREKPRSAFAALDGRAARATFVYYSTGQHLPEFEGVAITRCHPEERGLPVDLHLGVNPRATGADILLTGRISHFTPDAQERLLALFIHHLRCVGISDEPARLIVRNLPLFPTADAQRQTLRYAECPAPDPQATDITQRFHAIVAAHGDKPALRCADTRWTYRDLAREATAVAAWMATRGLVAGDVIGLALPRGADLIRATMGALQAGLTIAPIDPDYPPARRADMVALAGCKLVLSDNRLSDEVPHLSLPATCGPPVRPATPLSASAPPESSARESDSAAYIIFTSGSTGRPKGVLTTHRSIQRLAAGLGPRRPGPGDRIALIASPSFDGSFIEIFGALLNGAELISPEGDLGDHHDIAGLFRTNRVTTGFLTTGLFNLIVDSVPGAFDSFDWIAVGGEAMSPSHAMRFRLDYPRVGLVNGYGPTENGALTTCHLVEASDDRLVPIGKPMPGNMALVLGREGAPVPPGFAGELWIGGPGLALGYIGLPDQTAAVFRPFTRQALGLQGDGGIRLYATGDRVVMRPDGTLCYNGRRDAQVKLSGFRIEPREIEAAILRIEGVQDAMVIPRMSPDGRHVTALEAGIVGVEELFAAQGAVLQRRLRQDLPSIMVPSRFCRVAALPLTPNGKRDAGTLARHIDAMARADGMSEGLQGIDPKLIAVWTEFVAPPKAGGASDFFLSGGHSLGAMQMLAEVERRLDSRIPITDFFYNPTLGGLSDLIGRNPLHKPGKHLVLLRDGPRDQPPLVAVMGLHGACIWARDLVDALPLHHGAVYGLNLDSEDAQSAAVSSLYQLASAMVDEIEAEFSDRPVRLIGYSFAGFLAFVLTWELERRGKTPQHLIQIDPNTNLLPVEGDAPPPQEGAAAKMAALRTACRLAPISTPIDYVFCANSFPLPRRHDVEEWATLAQGGVRVFTLQTSHLAVIYGAWAKVLARTVTGILDGTLSPDAAMTAALTGDQITQVYAARDALAANNPVMALATCSALLAGSARGLTFLEVLQARILARSGDLPALKRLVQVEMARPNCNPPLLGEIARLLRQADDTRLAIRVLRHLFDCSGPEVYGAFDLVSMALSQGHVLRARWLAVLAARRGRSPLTGLLCKAAIARCRGQRGTAFDLILQAVVRSDIGIPHFTVILDQILRPHDHVLALRLIESAELQFKGAEILSRLRRDWETHAAQAT